MAFHQSIGVVNRATAKVAGSGDVALRKLSFRAMGTVCEVQFVAESEEQAVTFAEAAKGWTLAFEAKYSRFRADSLISEINRAAGKEWVAIDAEAEGLFALCDGLYFLTKGVLDPTALAVARLWDVKQEHPRIPSDAEIAAAKRLCGWPSVRREAGRIFLPREGMALDLGGFGKEWAVDQVAALAVQHGLKNFLVDFGHDLSAYGQPPHGGFWHVGLEDPEKPGTAWAGVGLRGQGMASSGNYLRCFVLNGKRYGHIVDPRTGYPAQNECQAVYVIAGSCLEAGILSTSALILGPHEGIELIRCTFGAEGCIVTPRERLYTHGFHQYLVTTQS